MLQYRPDDDQYTEGIITDMRNCMPTNRGGYQNVFDSADLGYTSLPGTCIGSAFLQRLDGTARVFAGTSSQIYEADQTTSGTSGSWLTVSRSTTYSTSGSWTFAQFGDVSLAASAENRLQFSNGAKGTAFADVAGAPFGKIVYTLNKRVILLNTSNYTGSGADGWAASSEGDYFTSTLWPPASTNNAAFGTLNEVGGPITAGCSLGSLAIAWKKSGMWVGQDQGPPLQITWQKIPGEYGCAGLRAWCYIDGGIFFVSLDDAYIFDGSRPVSVTDGIRRTLFSGLAGSSEIICAHDDLNNRVLIFLPGLQATLCYNYRTRSWGRATGYRGASSETIQVPLQVSNSLASGVNGLNQANAQSNVRVFAGNKLQQLGTSTMRDGTTAYMSFNWWNAVQGAWYYKGLQYQAPTLTGVTLSGFADVNTSQGPLVSNTQYPRLDGKFESINIRPRLTVTESAASEFEFTQIRHDMVKAGRA